MRRGRSTAITCLTRRDERVTRMPTVYRTPHTAVQLHLQGFPSFSLHIGYVILLVAVNHLVKTQRQALIILERAKA
jgi:hypothetical protein